MAASLPLCVARTENVIGERWDGIATADKQVFLTGAKMRSVAIEDRFSRQPIGQQPTG